MRGFEPGELGRCGIQRFERLYRSGEFFSNAVVLFVHGVQADRVRSTFVDNTLVRPAVIADRFYENRIDCGFIAALRQNEVKCFPP